MLIRLASILLTAISFAAGFAHLLELPNKMKLAAQDYLTVQQIYRGWALLGIVLFGALITNVLLAVTVRGTRGFPPAILAATCMALTLIVFFAFTYPVNVETNNWTRLPLDWLESRAKWEYSHAVNACIQFIALTGAVLAALVPGKDLSGRWKAAR